MDTSDDDYQCDDLESQSDHSVESTDDEFEQVKKPKKQTKQGKTRQRKPRHLFTDAEEERLRTAIAKYTSKGKSPDWKTIANAVNPKLPYKSVFQHYKRVTLARKGHKWTRDHNIELQYYVESHSHGTTVNMADIAKAYYDGHFADNQLRHHYEHHIRDNKKFMEEYKKVKDVAAIIERNRNERSTWKRTADTPIKKTPRAQTKKVKKEPKQPRKEKEVPIVEEEPIKRSLPSRKARSKISTESIQEEQVHEEQVAPEVQNGDNSHHTELVSVFDFVTNKEQVASSPTLKRRIQDVTLDKEPRKCRKKEIPEEIMYITLDDKLPLLSTTFEEIRFIIY
jgi:hypothetical protein